MRVYDELDVIAAVLHCVPKNETRLILNILCSFKSIAMKFSI